MKVETPTGSVCVATLDRRETNRNSFHEVRNAKMQEAASTAREIGSVILKNIWRGAAPSMIAASSISRGISSKKPLIIHTTTARLKAEWLMISAARVPTSPVVVKMT